MYSSDILDSEEGIGGPSDPEEGGVARLETRATYYLLSGPEHFSRE